MKQQRDTISRTARTATLAAGSLLAGMGARWHKIRPSPDVAGQGRTNRAAAQLAWGLWVLSLLLLIGYIPLRYQWHVVAPGTTLPPQDIAALKTNPLKVIEDVILHASYVIYSTMGALIVSRVRQPRIGWLFCAIGLLWASNEFTGFYAVDTLLVVPGALPAGLAAGWLQHWIWVIGLSLLLVFLPLLYPTGRLLSRRWKLVNVLAIGLLAMVIFLDAFAPGPLGNYFDDFKAAIPNPLGIAALGPVVDASRIVWFPLFLLFALIGATSLILRLRCSRGDERQQLKWFTYITALFVVSFVLTFLISTLLPSQAVAINAAFNLLLPLLLAALPLLTGLAILKYRLYDIDFIINRTLVYGALSVMVIGVYVLVVGSLSAAFQTSGNLLISLLATGLVAILLHPVRARVQRAVNRLLYGERDEPHAVLVHLGRRLEATLSPDVVGPSIVEIVAQALKLPYVAISLQQGEHLAIAASSGVCRVPETLLRLPIVAHGSPLGELLLAPREPNAAFTPPERALLADLARQAGIALHAVRLTTDLQQLTHELQQSRTQLVTTREEERRRLRRDLHDGLGSALTGMTFKLDAACNLLDRDPGAVRTLLNELKEQSQESIADIRRLVYNLLPPILDEWGLVAALREQVAHSQSPALQVEVCVPECLPQLSAAVEVAAYRIALEALANAARHAHASRCTLRLEACEDALVIEVQDNGQGLPPDVRAGVGISAMRERAAELGGSCVLDKTVDGGTRVTARLPLVKEE
jgi:signal transduction histidine kinase